MRTQTEQPKHPKETFSVEKNANGKPSIVSTSIFGSIEYNVIIGIIYPTPHLYTAEANAQRIAKALNMHDELVDALKAIIESCNPQDVKPNKNFGGLNLGQYYVGGCGIPSNKAIHLAINALKKAEQK